jgi:hypothetical protein
MIHLIERSASTGRRRPARWVALSCLLACVAACSAIVDRNDKQCTVDADCFHFGGYPACVDGVCVASGLGPTGCFYGTPTTDDQFLNQCTLSQTLAFDNCARLNVCDGTLPPLPGAR